MLKGRYKDHEPASLLIWECEGSTFAFCSESALPRGLVATYNSAKLRVITWARGKADSQRKAKAEPSHSQRTRYSAFKAVARFLQLPP